MEVSGPGFHVSAPSRVYKNRNKRLAKVSAARLWSVGSMRYGVSSNFLKVLAPPVSKKSLSVTDLESAPNSAGVDTNFSCVGSRRLGVGSEPCRKQHCSDTLLVLAPRT